MVSMPMRPSQRRRIVVRCSTFSKEEQASHILHDLEAHIIFSELLY